MTGCWTDTVNDASHSTACGLLADEPPETDEVAAIRATSEATVKMAQGLSLLRLTEAESLAKHVRDLALDGNPRSDPRGIELLMSLEWLCGAHFGTQQTWTTI